MPSGEYLQIAVIRGGETREAFAFLTRCWIARKLCHSRQDRKLNHYAETISLTTTHTKKKVGPARPLDCLLPKR